MEETISKLKDRTMELTQSEQQNEKRMKDSEDSLSNLWDNIKQTNILIIGVPEREERGGQAKNLFKEIMAENFPNLGKETDIQI